MAKILITDDSEFMRDIIATLIMVDGYEVGYAASGEELIAKFKDFRPDVVLLDVILPGMNGLETLGELLKIDPLTKVLICSAIAGQSVVAEEALAKGAYGCIKKPFNGTVLRDAIKRCLGK